MNPLSRLKQMRKAHRLYDELIRGETTLLVESFPFVREAFTQTVIVTEPALPAPEPPPPPPKKPPAPPKISYHARSEEDDLRDALDIGFGELRFDPVADTEKQSEQP